MQTLKVLDHGFVRLRNLAGPTRRTEGSVSDGEIFNVRPFDADDTDVANAARLSFEGHDQERSYEDEMKLTRYLMKNHHDTPFEAIEVWLEMKMPIFVARQLVRQRTQSIDEVSARYKQLPPEWYIPEIVGGKPPNAKQGQVDSLPPDVQANFKRLLNDDCAAGYEKYQWAIGANVAMEHARLFLHVNHYTHWMTKMNLRNLFMSFLRLRDHGHAQTESAQYAKATFTLMEPHLPGLMSMYKELIAGQA